MILYLGIIFGVIFAGAAIKKGFYAMWPILFNLGIAIYLGVMLTPAAAKIIPTVNRWEYGYAGSIAAIAVVAFVILHVLTLAFFAAAHTISLPKILNGVGAALLGFLSGLLVWGFVCLLVLIAPISQNNFVKQYDLGKQLLDASERSVVQVCNLVNNLSMQNNSRSVDQVIDWLLGIEDEPQTNNEDI